MKLLGRRKDDSGALEENGAPIIDEDLATPEVARATHTTAPKGRPTPKRSDRRRGPVAPAPMTTAEARARRKSMSGPKLSREERKEQSAVRRAAMSQRRERMLAGDEAYMLPRDQGPVRRFVRDLVDGRRNLLGLFTPSAVALLVVMFAVPQLQLFMSPAMMVLMVLMVIDGLILGRKVNRMVDEKFPDNVESRWKLGLYAAGRASQLRRMRAPRPQVKRGTKAG